MTKRERQLPSTHDMDERVKIPLDPELAIRALLRVDPDAEPAKDGKRHTKAGKPQPGPA